MSQEPHISPGTVSKILWHFTGGPTWNAEKKRQNSSPKPAESAYENLKSILRSRELRLGSYREVVKLVLPSRRKVNPVSREVEIQANVPVQIESSAICCLSDIPAPHLRYHADRYGKFAIGFHREAVIRARFNPVLYTLENTRIIRSMYEGFSSLEFGDPSAIEDAASRIEGRLDDLASEHEDLDLDVSGEVWEIQSEALSLASAVEEAKSSLQDLVAFVKTFSEDEFGTIYCEREWRSTRKYDFDLDDVAMIVLPRVVGKNQYFRKFVEHVTPRIRLPRRIPVIPWEDLIEH